MSYPKKPLPLWDECDRKGKAGVATNLELFIWNHEPAGPDAATWRRELCEAINEQGPPGIDKYTDE